MKKRTLIWILMFVSLALAGSSWLIEVQADDTYNFYFQKAPGPVTVNQGAAAASPAPTVQVKGDAVVTPTSPAPATTAAAPAAAEESGQRSWELSIGFGAAKAGSGSSDSPYYWAPPSSSGMIFGNQFAVGLQFNMNENFALQGEAFYLTKMPETKMRDGSFKTDKGSRLDYGASLVITPFRLRAGSSTRLAFSGLLGGMSVPFHAAGPSWAPPGEQQTLSRAGSLTYGARIALELGNRLALQGTVRRIDRFSATHGTASVALLF